MSTITKELPGAPSAAGLRAKKADPVCIEMPVQVRSIEGLPVPGCDEIPKAFREDTRTLIVFQHGGVLRMATKVKRGQMLAVTHTKSGQEVPCRVVNVRSSGPSEEYVEVEFTQRVSGFWGIHFPSDPLNEIADAAREKAESDKVAAEDAARVDAARAAAEAAEANRREAEKVEAKKLAAEKDAKEKAAARLAVEDKANAERLEAVKLAEQVAAQRAEAERIASEKEVKRRADAARREAEREAELAEQQRLTEMREASEKMAVERAEAQRVAAERAAQEIAAKERERAQKIETERAAKEKAEAAARAAAAKLAAERAEAERRATELAAEEAAVKARERARKLEAEKAAQEKAEAETRAAREKKLQEAEETRAIIAKVEAERRVAEIATAERAAQEKAAAERLATEKVADTVLGYGASEEKWPSTNQEKVAAKEKAAKDKAEAMRVAAEAAAADKAARRNAEGAAKKLAEETAIKARTEKEHNAIVARLEKERVKNEKAATAKIEADEKKAAKQLQAESRAARRSGAGSSTLFGGAEEADARLETEEIEETSAGDDDGTISRGPDRSKNKAIVFGTLDAEIAHDRNELRARSKSRSSVVLAIAASVVILVGGGAWWLVLGPGAAARDKALQSDSASGHSQITSQVSGQINSQMTSPGNLPAAIQTLQDGSAAAPASGGAAANDAKVGERVNAAPIRANGAAENKLSSVPTITARNSSTDSPGGKDTRTVDTTSRVKDTPMPVDKPAAGTIENKSASETARKITARPALEATLRAPVKINSGSAAGAGDFLQVPDMKGESTVANGAAASALGGRSGAANALAPPPPMGGNVVSGRLLKSVPPQYPDLARQRHVDGDVVVRADVDAHGNVVSVTPLGGPDLLRSAAMNSVKQWKYSPALLNGQPVAMQVQVTVKFRSSR